GQDRQTGRSLASSASVQAGSARGLDPARGDPAAAGEDAASQGPGRRPHAVGPAAARRAPPRRLALPAKSAADQKGTPMGGCLAAAGRGPAAGNRLPVPDRDPGGSATAPGE